MARKTIALLALLGFFSLATYGQELTAREYAKAHGILNRQTAVTLSTPHACTVSKQHPCIYYGGDIDPNDPQEDGLSNENTLFVQGSWTYDEVKLPVQLKISAAFTNNLQTYAIIDPQTANWDFRMGVSEGNGGTQIASGIAPAELTDTGRNAFGFEEYELLTRTPVSLPSGNVWFGVEPNCTNPKDRECNIDAVCPTPGGRNCYNNTAPRYLESDTDGLNGINAEFTVTSKTGMGPTFNCAVFFSCGESFWQSWCNDGAAACGDGMSAGLLK